jgi:hypothetical protein
MIVGCFNGVLRQVFPLSDFSDHFPMCCNVNTTVHYEHMKLGFFSTFFLYCTNTISCSGADRRVLTQTRAYFLFVCISLYVVLPNSSNV